MQVTAMASSSSTFRASSEGYLARGAVSSGGGSSGTAFFPARAFVGSRVLSSSPSSFSAKFGISLSVSSKRSTRLTQVRALDPDFYKIPYVEGIPVGKRLKLWNLPPDCDHGELHGWLDSIDGVNVESLEFTNDPELNAQGIGGFVEFGTKQEACMAIVRLDGRKLKGRCIRMDFVEKRPHEREIGGRRNRPNRNYPRDRSYSSTYAGGGYSGSSDSTMQTQGTYVSTASISQGFANGTLPSSPMSGSPSPGLAPGMAPSSPPPMPPRAYGPTAHRIFVGNLSWNMDDTQLTRLFQEHGNVLEARIMRDRENGNSRGFGFVAMASAEDMDAAISALNGKSVNGRTLKVDVASR